MARKMMGSPWQAAMPEGNKHLLQRGAVGFPHPFPESSLKLAKWLGEHSDSKPKPASQLELF
jgi:hypothetical protein